MKATLIILLVFIALSAIVFGPRVYKDIQKKRNYANTFAIQNVKTGKCIRVYNAGIDDGTKIILYSHHNWECITWQFIQLDDKTFLLKNLYTQKTFEPSSNPQSETSLWQQTLGGSSFQYWEFIEQPDKTYLIRLKDTELYVSITSNENNSPIVLLPKQEIDSQLWRLVRQNPIF